jgi:hypothetical protein
MFNNTPGGGTRSATALPIACRYKSYSNTNAITISVSMQMYGDDTVRVFNNIVFTVKEFAGRYS